MESLLFKYLNFCAKIEPFRLLFFGAKIQISKNHKNRSSVNNSILAPKLKYLKITQNRSIWIFAAKISNLKNSILARKFKHYSRKNTLLTSLLCLMRLFEVIFKHCENFFVKRKWRMSHFSYVFSGKAGALA